MPFALPAATIDYFPLSGKCFLRHAIFAGAPAPSSKKLSVSRNRAEAAGSVILLQDYGGLLEEMEPIITPLVDRGFHVGIFDWATHKSTEDTFERWLPPDIKDFRDPVRHLQEIFFSHFLIHLPAPFYILGIGMGGLLALSAHHHIKSQIRRMMLLSPTLHPRGYRANGLFHHYARFMADLGLGGWRTNQFLSETTRCLDPITMARQARVGCPPALAPTLGCYQALLDAAQWVLSHDYREQLSIPLLFVLSMADRFSPPHLTRKFCDSLRCASNIILRHAHAQSSQPSPSDSDQSTIAFLLQKNTLPYRQFWAAFDAFIPGTGAPNPDRSLEDGVMM